MSDSIPTKWISQYIIQVAETFGKSFTEVPIDAITPAKNKRVQIIEFLTYGDGAAIWGRVSDKESVIPVCFTKDAVAQYMKELQGRRLTEAKNAIFSIGQFRPTFVPIPVGNNRPKLTKESHITLEAGIVKYIGPGSGVYDSPQDVELNTKVRAWVRGLRQGGDGGDVLQCRKQVTRDHANSPPPVHETRSVTPHVTNQLEAFPKPQVRQPECDSGHIVSEPPVRISDPMREYRKRWIYVERNRWAYMKPYIDDKVQNEQVQPKLPVQDNLIPNDMNVDPKSQPCTPSRMRTPEQAKNEQTTPRISEWSPSVTGSPAGVLPCVPPDDHTTAEPSTDKNPDLPEPSTSPATSPLHPPTPAQRVRQPSTSETRIQSTPSPSFVLLPPSSFPVHIRRSMVRRAPRPGLPPSPTDCSSSTQILVPNSDPSSTQAQTRSQSQPLSQSFSESQSYRPTFPSQLTQEFKPGKTSTPAAVKQDPGASKILVGGQPESHRDGDWTSSPGFTALDVNEELGHEEHQLSGTSPDEQQIIEVSASEVPDTCVDAVNGADVVAVPNEPSNGSKHVAAPSQTPLHSPLHSLFSCPSASWSQIIPITVSPAASPHPAEPIVSTSRDLLHDTEAWKQPSFMSARKGKRRAMELNEKPHERPTSPLTSQKHRKSQDEKIIKPHPTRPPNKDEKSTSSALNEKGNHPVESIISGDLRKKSSSIERLSLPSPSRDVNRSQDVSPGLRQPVRKKRRTRLLGYEVDFDHIPINAKGPNTWMNMRHIRTILLRTGRIRTLGDEVTRDGSIFTRSD